MKVTSESDIEQLVENDPWMMQILHAAESLNLPDWWIGAGFLRNKVWDTLEDNEPQPSKDVDLVYFDPANTEAETDWAHDKKMKQDFPFAEWEIRNQARMHYVSGFEPFISTANGISHWVETATCVAVKLEDGQPRFLFCYGTDDLLGLVARPTPYFTGDLLKTFHERLEKKQWRKRWPHLRVETR
jgi:uncharacterized protein